MRIIAYLGFNGRCEEAFKFYEQVLGGKIGAMLTYGGTPGAEHVPPELCGRIMHASLHVGDAALMGADGCDDQDVQVKGLCVSIHLDNPAEGERIFNALSEGGSVQMPFAETFWAAGFGMCTDRFGIPWIINCEAAA